MNSTQLAGPSLAAEPDGSFPKELRDKLLSAARQACGHAYCPYSRFPVGAAVLTDSGTIYAGCNVENASFGLTICAERNAVFQAISSGARKIRAVAVFTPTTEPCLPCGACRQVINEFGADAAIISGWGNDQTISWKLSQLLPHAFGPANLSK